MSASKSFTASLVDFVRPRVTDEQWQKIKINELSKLDCLKCAESRKTKGWVCDAHWHDYMDCGEDDCLTCVYTRLKKTD